jgi:hypothetical protein
MMDVRVGVGVLQVVLYAIVDVEERDEERDDDVIDDDIVHDGSMSLPSLLFSPMWRGRSGGSSE